MAGRPVKVKNMKEFKRLIRKPKSVVLEPLTFESLVKRVEKLEKKTAGHEIMIFRLRTLLLTNWQFTKFNSHRGI